MIARRIALATAALGVLCAAAATLVFAAAFAIYALLSRILTPAGAAGVLVLLAALTAAGAVIVLMRVARSPFKGGAKPKARPEAPASIVDRLLDLAQNRPLAAAGAAAAAGLLAFANPALVTAVLRAFTGSRTSKR